MQQKVLVLLKPDCVRRGLCGTVLARYELKGLSILGMRLLTMTERQAQLHYAEHRHRPFYASLVEFITSGPVVAVALEGEDAISAIREMNGDSKRSLQKAGTIRGDFATSVQENMVHASSTSEAAERELALFFNADYSGPSESIEIEETNYSLAT